jgi:TolA-binding protein
MKEKIKKNLVAFVLVIAALALLVGFAIGYPVGSNNGSSKGVVALRAEQDEKYKELSKKVDGKQDELDQANRTIAESDNIKNGIDDLNSQHDDIEQRVKDAQAQLDNLTGQVDAAKKLQVSDGVWQVGKDIDAGTYRAMAAVPEDCYWAITVGDDIVQNDLPGGGYPQATVSDGQQLKLNGCGTWSKQ